MEFVLGALVGLVLVPIIVGGIYLWIMSMRSWN